MNTSLESAWRKFLEAVKTQLPSPSDYHMWFEPLRPISWENGRLTIRVPNREYYDRMENIYMDILSRNLKATFGTNVNLNYQVLQEKTRTYSTPHTFAQPEVRQQVATPTPMLESKRPAQVFNSHLDSRMRLDNFYQSLCNRLACTAASSIIDNPGHNPFNPLFVHGASGVGKTHIMHAIGNEILHRDHSKQIIYVPAATFKQQYVHATMVAKKPEQFFTFYQNVDILLIDDIQELTDATSTQNAFFQIFNNLKLLGKQIVITSDRPPVDLKGLEERLYTRLKWGLTVEIERPDVHLRKTILESMLRKEGVTIPEDVFRFIVKHCKDNVRDIEGSLTSLLAHALYNSTPVDLALAVRVMSQTVGIEEKKLTVMDIAKLVCNYYNVDIDDIMSKKRAHMITQARQITMYLAKEHTSLPLSRIGTELGGRDHSTVIYAHKNIQTLLSTDARLKDEMSEIRELLNL